MSKPRYRQLRLRLSEAQNHHCAYCGVIMEHRGIYNPHDYSANGLLSPLSTTIDHIIPQCKGGKWTYNNCVAACAKCNNERSNKDPYQFFRAKQKQIKKGL